MNEASEDPPRDPTAFVRNNSRLNWRRGVLIFWFILAAQFTWRSIWGFASEGFSWLFVVFAVIAVVSAVVGLRLARRYRASPSR